MTSRAIRFFTVALLLVVAWSCNKFVDINPAPNLISSANVFTNDKTANAAVIGVYVLMRNSNPSFANGTLSLFPSLSADELLSTTFSSEYESFQKNELLPDNSSVYGQMWIPAYRLIYRANAIIEGVDRSTDLSSDSRNHFIGEMKLVRAFYYFYLTNLFGDVPLALTTEYENNSTLPNTPKEEILSAIQADLEDAVSLLPEDYITEDRARPNKWAATALLARLLLYRGDYQKAIQLATDVLNSGSYQLEGINEVFKIASKETLWQIAPSDNSSNSAEGGLFIPYESGIVPQFVVTDHLLASFEQADERAKNWISEQVVSGVKYHYPYKYKVPTYGYDVAEYDIVLRMAELYLIRTEANIFTDQLEAARNDLNAIRTRAGLLPIETTSRNELLAALIKERRTEYFAEWGHRWLDLKRWKLADEILEPIKSPLWQSYDTLYPIPVSEIRYNPFLKQNAGY